MGSGLVLLLLDGPRTRSLHRADWDPATRFALYGSRVRDEKEMYPYDVDDAATRWRWRLRFVAFLVARGLVTEGWTRQPPEAW